ncbi:MAG: glycosyltransferase family 4 protein [Stellaceae bacterium]
MLEISVVEKPSDPANAALHCVHRPHFLHIFPSLGVGGVPLRMVRIINHFGKRFRHSLISLDENFDAAEGLSRDLDVSLLRREHRRRSTLRAIASNAFELRRLGPDLLLTYNWGAIEWAMANRLLLVSRHIHLEAGFGQAEADSQITRRILFRRLALARCACVVVPSKQLAEIAGRVWGLPPTRVAYVPNGVDAARFSRPVRDRIPGFARRPGELVIGTVAPLRPEKNIGRLLRVFAELDHSPPLRLIIAGDGVERPSLERLAVKLGIADRAIFTGRVAPETVLGSFDIFALSSDTEQMPNSVLEAMAASRAIAAVDVGDIKRIVSENNREFIVARDDEQALSAAIDRLLGDPARREALGTMNRQRVIREYSQDRMFSAYSAILGG